MSVRHDAARAVAADVRRLEHCDPLRTATIDSIERRLADYTIARLSDCRQQIVAETMDAAAKQRAIAIVSACIHEESK